MRKSKLFLVFSREFSVRVKKKSFIIMTLLTPLLFAALIALPSLIMLFSSGDKGREILVIDRTERYEEYFHSSEDIIYIIDRTVDLDGLKENFPPHLDAAVEIVEDDKGRVRVTSYSLKQVGLDLKSDIESRVEKAIKSERIESYEIENLEEIISDINVRVSLKSITLSESGEEKHSIVELFMGISYISSFMIYMFIFMFGSMVMRGVIEEKSNRVIEVIISSVKPFELMLGKILGVGAVALLQFSIWIILTGGIFFGVQSFIGADKIADEGIEMLTQSGVEQLSPEAVGQITKSLKMEEGVTVDDEDNFMEEILGALSSIPFLSIILSFLAYFVLGYLLYAALFAAVGSAVDTETDSQQLTLPITLPLIIGLFLMIHTFQYPDSSLSFWGSIIPFTSPMVMMARIPFGVPVWELALSLTLLLVTFLFVTYISAKIYRTGILMYGKKVTFKEIFKWIRY